MPCLPLQLTHHIAKENQVGGVAFTALLEGSDGKLLMLYSAKVTYLNSMLRYLLYLVVYIFNLI